MSRFAVQVAGFAGDIACDVLRPAELHAGSRLLICLPGGGVTRRYFAMPGFDFSAAMLAAGHLVVLIDPPGVGESTRPENGYALTPEVMARALHEVVAAVRADFPDLEVIGVGHSAGAMLAIVQQDLFADFAALVLLGFGTGGLPEYFKPGVAAQAADHAYLRANLGKIAAEQFGTAYLAPPVDPRDTPEAMALRGVHDKVVTVVAMQSMAPGNVAAELARVTVPIFMSVGDKDLTGPPHLLPGAAVACRDLALHVVSPSGHHLFVSPAAPLLLRRVAGWLELFP